MSDQNNLREKSTLEMKTDFDKILSAIGKMRDEIGHRFDDLDEKISKLDERIGKMEAEQLEIRKKIDKLKAEQSEMKQYMELQFEANRQGLVKSYNQYNQLISEISQNRSAIFSTKAAVGELQETVYLRTRNVNQPV